MPVRLDKWLWSVRLYKTRSLATKECNAGRIKRDNTTLKPSASIQTGDHLEVPSPDGTHKRQLEVVDLLEKRVSAPLARAAYIDHTSADVLKAAEETRAQRRENRHLRQEGDQGRMTKKKRREWKSGLRGFFD
jgi:ribosome-associated heat shock protein Hsp15